MLAKTAHGRKAESLTTSAPAAERSSARQDQSREDQIKTMTQTDENNTGNILQEIWQNGQLAWRLYADPRVSFLLKAMVPALWLAYFILPIDLVPDLIPVLGQLDDIAVLLLLVRLFISLAPPEIVAEHRGEAPAGSAGPDAQQTAGATGASRNGAKPAGSRDDVIDADYRVVNDA